MDPRVFIGSSSIAGEERDWLQVALDKKGVLAEPWDQSTVFEPSKSTWENLADKVKDFDFAVFILTPDDRIATQGDEARRPRDNVILELGLFTGCLGRDRVFFLAPGDIDDLALPTDLLGITFIPYSAKRFQSLGAVALGPAAMQIAKIVKARKRRPLTSLLAHQLTPEKIEELFNVTAITHAFPNRADSTRFMLNDIATASSSVRMYARVYLSELVKDHHSFSSAIRAAAQSAPGRLIVKSTTTNHSDATLVGRLHGIEDPRREAWPHVEQYKEHLATTARIIDRLYGRIERCLEGVPERRPVVLSKHVVDEVLPQSMLIIDDKIVYACFYQLSSASYGTHAPTLRLVNEAEREDWADTFIREAAHIDGKLSSPTMEAKEI